MMHVVLVEPEIPQNTGNIGRTCVLTGTRLHLVKPLGFSLDDRYLKRAGLDYWPLLDLEIHDNLEEAKERAAGGRWWLATTKAAMLYSEVEYQPDDWLWFGKETRGLPADLLQVNATSLVRIPMRPEVRSLNLGNSVAIILYEALRQQGFPGLG